MPSPFFRDKLKKAFLNINSSKIGAQTTVIKSITQSGKAPLLRSSLIDDWLPEVELISLNIGKAFVKAKITILIKIDEARLIPYSKAIPIPKFLQNFPFSFTDFLKSVIRNLFIIGTTAPINDR